MPRPLPSGSFTGTCILLAAVAEGVLGLLRLDARSWVPLKKMAMQPRKGWRDASSGGVGVTAVYGTLSSTGHMCGCILLPPLGMGMDPPGVAVFRTDSRKR